jgi:hypothetical protein
MNHHGVPVVHRLHPTENGDPPNKKVLKPGAEIDATAG